MRSPSLEPLENRVLLYSGNILVGAETDGFNTSITEYSQTGSKLHTVAVPTNGADGGSRDFQVDASGSLQVWTGVFNPVLQRHGPVASGGSWVKESSKAQVAGWSTINRTFYGGIATLGQYVFATDQDTGGGAENGLIRFDSKNNYAATRFASGEDFSDVSIGMDGKLYAMNGGETFQAQVKVYDPGTLKLLKTVNVPGFDNACVTADSSGNIFVGAFFDSKLWKLSPSGAILKTVNIEAKDLDVSSDNQILAGDGAKVYLLDDNLTTLHSFGAGSYSGANFVAFATYQAPPAGPASVAGHVFNDSNDNAKKDTGEGNLAGWKVYVDANRNGALDAGEKTAVTDSSGNYKLTGLAAGSYRIRLNIPSGWRRTVPGYGYTELKLAAGHNAVGYNFGATQRVRISGTVFQDANGNRTKDAGEGVLTNWTVFLDTNGDKKPDNGERTLLTDGSGNFTFTNLAAGTYTLRIFQQTGWKLTTPTTGSFTIKLTSGATSTSNRFGEKKS